MRELILNEGAFGKVMLGSNLSYSKLVYPEINSCLTITCICKGMFGESFICGAHSVIFPSGFEERKMKFTFEDKNKKSTVKESLIEVGITKVLMIDKAGKKPLTIDEIIGKLKVETSRYTLKKLYIIGEIDGWKDSLPHICKYKSIQQIVNALKGQQSVTADVLNIYNWLHDPITKLKLIPGVQSVRVVFNLNEKKLRVHPEGYEQITRHQESLPI